MNSTGYLKEIFSSIQGEGLLLGRRQIFIRFLGCNLKCSYCDTPESRERKGDLRVQEAPDLQKFTSRKNPITVEATLACLDSLNLHIHHSVSMTGGEPLLQRDYLAELGTQLRRKNVNIFLETNGTLPDALQKCLGGIDIIGMDWKLPSSTAQQDNSLDHVRFLKIGIARKIFVKLVVTDTTELKEFETACLRISEVGSEIPIVVQPVTPAGAMNPPSKEFLLQLSSVARHYLEDIRIIPQVHKLIGLQ